MTGAAGLARGDAAGTDEAALFVASGDAATSPALAFSPADRDFADADVRLTSVLARAAFLDGFRSSDDLRIHPSRETLTHPAGPPPNDLTATDVPASSDARLRALVDPLARTTTVRFPTRGDELPRCDVRRARSTNPSSETFAYAPRVSMTRTATPGWTLPMAFPFGEASTAAGVVTTRD